jgi:hypothetical protein
MDVEEALRRWGGVASRAQLVAATSRAQLEAAIVDGTLVRLARGRYGSPRTEAAVAAAHTISGVLSHESAALQHGWAVLLTPDLPHVSLPANRKVRDDARRAVVVHRADLGPDDVSGSATSQQRTVVDCMRNLELRSALAVADSALRAGRAPSWLAGLARDARGRGSGQVRRVAGFASALAANPFESGLRAISHEVPALNMRPQVPLWAGGEFLGRPDLVDSDLGIIAEADSFEWHGGRTDLVNDAQRYNAMAVDGWLVLRFTWEDVMFDAERVLGVMAAAADQRRKPSSSARRSA